MGTDEYEKVIPLSIGSKSETVNAGSLIRLRGNERCFDETTIATDSSGVS